MNKCEKKYLDIHSFKSSFNHFPLLPDFPLSLPINCSSSHWLLFPQCLFSPVLSHHCSEESSNQLTRTKTNFRKQIPFLSLMEPGHLCLSLWPLKTSTFLKLHFTPKSLSIHYTHPMHFVSQEKSCCHLLRYVFLICIDDKLQCKI